MEVGKSYYITLDQYSKIIIDGHALPPIKKDPDFSEKHNAPEIGCCARVVYDRAAQSPKLEIIKRCATEKDIIYG